MNFSSKEIRSFSILTMMATCGLLGVDMHLTSMPEMMHLMSTDQTHMQSSISIFLLGTGISQLFYGPLSDKYGRKPIVIFGLLVAAISNLLVPVSTNVTYFLILRVFQGLGCGVCIGLGRTIAVDMVQGEKYAIATSYMSLFVSLSPLCAPAIGGYIQKWIDWQSNFIILGLIIILVLLLYVFLCEETNKNKKKNACSPVELYQNYKKIASNKIFAGCVVIAGMGMAITMVYATLSSFIFQRYFNLDPTTYGWIVFITSSGGIIGKIASPILIKKITSINTLTIGVVLLAFSGVLILATSILRHISILELILFTFIAILCAPFLLPFSASKALSPFDENRGVAGALYGCFQMLIAFAMSFIVSSINYNSIYVLGTCYVVMGFIGIAIIAFIKKEDLIKDLVDREFR